MDNDNNTHEVLTQEVFRELLVKNRFANDYVITFPDEFYFKEDDQGVSGTVNIFKGEDSWLVWEYDFDGECFAIARLDSQEEAYIEAGKRRGFEIKPEDLSYAKKNNEELLDLIHNGQKWLLSAIEFYERTYNAKADKLIEQYALLNSLGKTLSREKITNRQLKNDK